MSAPPYPGAGWERPGDRMGRSGPDSHLSPLLPDCQRDSAAPRAQKERNITLIIPKHSAGRSASQSFIHLLPTAFIYALAKTSLYISPHTSVFYLPILIPSIITSKSHKNYVTVGQLLCRLSVVSSLLSFLQKKK